MEELVFFINKKFTYIVIIQLSIFLFTTSDIRSSAGQFLDGDPSTITIKLSNGEYNVFNITHEDRNLEGFKNALQRVWPSHVELSWVGEIVEEDLDEEFNEICEELHSREIESLTIQGDLGPSEVAAIGTISSLERLTSSSLSITYNDYMPWQALTNLRKIDLTRSGFANDDEWWENFPKHGGAEDIIFKRFLETLLPNIPLSTLIVNENSLFPEVRNSRSRTGADILRRFMDWRKQQIKACAILLAKHFYTKGEELKMRETNLGDLFLEPFNENFDGPPPQYRNTIIDFSNNYFSVEKAAKFVSDLIREDRSIDLNIRCNSYNSSKLKITVAEQLMEGSRVTLI